MDAAASLPSVTTDVSAEMGPTQGGVASNVATSPVASSPSSSSSAVEWKYDVYLSYSGADTGRVFSDHLHLGLAMRGIYIFMDDTELRSGDTISPYLVKAIEESRFVIVVISKDYASSTRCLEELIKICECMKDQNRILPLYHHVDRNNSFSYYLDRHEKSGRHTAEKVQQRIDALKKVAGFSGWDSGDYRHDADLIQSIVEFMFNKLQPFAI